MKYWSKRNTICITFINTPCVKSTKMENGNETFFPVKDKKEEESSLNMKITERGPVQISHKTYFRAHELKRVLYMAIHRLRSLL
jgi:hypothetical protein